MTYIGLDLGYKEETSMVVVNTNGLNRFNFITIKAGTEFDDLVNIVAKKMIALGVPLENVSAPRHPAFEKALSTRFKKETK